MPKYTPLTNAFARWLFPLVDRFDWSYRASDGAVKRANLLVDIEDFGVDDRFPQKLTRTFIEEHLHDREELHVFPSGKVALLMLDVDAHHGEPDAFEAARWIQARYFSNSYLEASGRGFHVYVLVELGACPRSRFNELLDVAEHKLQLMLMHAGFQSTVELKGRFTTRDFVTRKFTFGGEPFLAPRLPHHQADLDQLTGLTAYRPVVFKPLDEEATLAVEMERELELSEALVNNHQADKRGERPLRNLVVKESPCAWARMKWACFDFTCQYHAVPSLEKLLQHYKDVYGTDDGDEERVRRATYALRYCRYDPAKANDGGYAANKAELLALVRERCTDRNGTGYDYGLTDEDLAIALYTFQRASFSVAHDPKRQWTVGNAALAAMFRTLKAAGLTDRGCGSPTKQIALKMLLQRAGLIECLDRKYIFGNGNGISKKWTIGPQHPRYAEWVRFAEHVTVVYAEKIIEDRKAAVAELKAREAAKEAEHVVNHAVNEAWALVA